MKRRVPLLLSLATVLALDVLLFVPAFAFPAQASAVLPFRLSLELIALVTATVWLVAAPRACAAMRWLTVAWYAATLPLLVYQHAFAAFFLRRPALWDDARLLHNLVNYVSDQWSVKWAALVVGGVLGLASCCAALAVALKQLSRLEGPAVRATSAGLLLCCLASVAWFGLAHPRQAVALVSAPLADNYRASRQRAAEFRALTEGAADPRYRSYSQVKLARRPNVALLMVEAYGELCAACDTKGAYQVLMQRIEQRLAKRGYHARTGYSTAPVYGGQSWLSISSVQLGVRIDSPRKYELVENVGAQTPSLTRFFREQGYFTAAVQPGNADRTGLKRFDVFNRQLVVDAPGLDYRGLRYGWQGIPDQYTFGRIAELLPTMSQPWFLFYMSVSTHHPWDAPFVYVTDWKALQDPALDTQAIAAPWQPIVERASIGPERQGYFHTVEYEWRGLAELIERDEGEGTVFIVLGDHQPKLPCDGDKPVSWNTPLHVISKDAALVERFAGHGFEPGLYAEPGQHPPLQHEGLFSLLVSELSAQWGDQANTVVSVAPQGISLSSLYQ